MVIFTTAFTIQANKHGRNGGRTMKKCVGAGSPLIVMNTVPSTAVVFTVLLKISTKLQV